MSTASVVVRLGGSMFAAAGGMALVALLSAPVMAMVQVMAH